MMNKRFILLAAFFSALALLAFTPSPVLSKVYIDLEAPAIRRLPVAIQDFRYTGPPPSGPKDAELIESIKALLMGPLVTDLNFSRLFTIIDRAAFLEDTEHSGMTAAEIDFREWRTIGADALIKGSFTIEGSRLVVEMRFYDCIRETRVLGKRYIGSTKNPRRLIHFFADQLYEELTGRPGVFTTRVLFVSDKTGNKEVYVSDYDGANPFQITRNRSINLSPQWSPDGKKIYYTSYKKGQPSFYELNLVTGRDTLLSNKPGINIGGRPSPDGKSVALTLSVDRSAELYLLDLYSGKYKRLTNNYGIDVSPAWSPDGKKLAFVSDRAGNPHIYMLDLATGKEKRLTYSGKYNSSPAWSPDGKLIAFSRSDAGRFNIWVMKPDGDGLNQLTFEGNNRSPSWSPDGRFIVFSSTARGTSSLYIMQADGTGLTRVQTGVGNEKSPAWSPFLQ